MGMKYIFNIYFDIAVTDEMQLNVTSNSTDSIFHFYPV